ncbi:MAG: ribosome biogenesis GTPase Der [Campylobacterales bacterium]|nr:ribosome biogenesis GTPase Der [Campylobacterales bacterium]
MKKIAIIGRPNVGKSSLFNRILGFRDAIISDIAGTTRDVKRRVFRTYKGQAELWDTGGIEDRDELFDRVKEKSLKAAEEADILLFVCDGKGVPTDEEKRLFFQLQKLNKPLALIVNKVDNEKENEAGWQFLEFGAKVSFLVSVSHNRNISKLLDWIDGYLDEEPQVYDLSADDDESLEDFLDDDEEVEEVVSNDIKVAIIGRVNVGKSSLLNALTGSNRSIVSSVAGTTIDPVDETIEYNGRNITFVDTAGIRKRSKIVGIEKWALDRSEKVLDNADVAILVLDASSDFTEQDERVAGFIDKYKTGAVIVLNKWDLITREPAEILQDIKDEFKFLDFAPIITVSALSGKRVHKIMDTIVKVYENYSQKIPTRKLNDVIKFASEKHKLPGDHGRIVKIKFATQYATKPPKISLVMNIPTLHFSYKRYLVNMLREQFDFEGSPIVIHARKRGERDDEEEGGEE